MKEWKHEGCCCYITVCYIVIAVLLVTVFGLSLYCFWVLALVSGWCCWKVDSEL